MKASPISCEETSARRWRATASSSPSFAGMLFQTLSATNSRMASATLVDEAMPATHAANDEPVPSVWSHMVRKPVITLTPAEIPGGEGRGRRMFVLLNGAGVEGQRHRSDEEAGLSVKVVVDQGGINVGLPGHRPQARAVVPLGSEDALGRLDDLAPGVDVAGPAARRPRGTHEGYSPSENFLWYNSSVMNLRTPGA